jgi:hypothetical protein
MLTSCWVADGEAKVPVEAAEDEEAVAGGLQTEEGGAQSRDGLELAEGGVEGDEV